MSTKKGQKDFTDAIKSLDILSEAVKQIANVEEKRGSTFMQMIDVLDERLKKTGGCNRGTIFHSSLTT